MSDQDVKYTAQIETSGFQSGVQSIKSHLKSFGDTAESQVGRATSAMEQLRGKFVALAAVMAGGTIFGRAVEQTAKLAEDSINLGKAMGTSATAAAQWMSALDDVGSSSEELAGASRGLLKQLKTNEEGLNGLGLKTRDAAGNFRPFNEIMLDAIKVVNEFQDGTDRSMATQAIFGKGVVASSNLLKLNAETLQENTDYMNELGMVVGQTSVQAYQAFDAATDKSHLLIKALTTTIGQVMMPVLTKLAEWFNSIGPAAMVAVRGAVGGVAAAFWGLKNGVVVAWETINAMVISVAEPIRALAVSLYKLVTGDFKGAADEIANVPDRIGEAWATAWKRIVASSIEARDRMREIFLPDNAPAPTGSDGQRTYQAGEGKAGSGKPARQGRTAAPAAEKAETERSVMAYYEAALAEEKHVQSVLTDGRQFSKEQELAFWRWLADAAQMGGKDRAQVVRKMATLEVEIRREAILQQREVDAENAQSAETLALARVEGERVAADAMLGLQQITESQALDLEGQFEEQRYQIKEGALRERLALLEADPDSSPVEMARIKNQLLLIEQDYQNKLTEIGGKKGRVKLEEKGPVEKTIDQGQSVISSQMAAYLSATQKWSDTVRGIWGGLKAAFIKNMITEPFAQWAAGLAKMLAVKLGFMAQEKVLQKTASTEIVGTKATEAESVIAANAAEAGSGAGASQASIPYVGPVLALAAMASVFAAVKAMRGNVKSASGGYDIPAGVNPMVQAHAEEMILPAKHANTIRRLGEGVEDGGGGAVHVHITAMDGADVRRVLTNNPGALAAAIRAARRDNHSIG